MVAQRRKQRRNALIRDMNVSVGSEIRRMEIAYRAMSGIPKHGRRAALEWLRQRIEAELSQP